MTVPPDSPHENERRRHRRLRTDLAARVRAANWVSEGRAVDLSEGGVLIDGIGPESGEVQIELQLDGGSWHRIDAEVVRFDAVVGGGRLAAEFAAAATDGGRSAIRAFLDAHLGEYRDLD